MNRSRRSPIGIDLDARAAHAAQLVRSADGWEVLALASVTRTSHEPVPSVAEVRRIADALERLNFKGGEIVLSVPGDKLLTSALELPPRSSGAPLDQLATMEVARAHRRDAGSLEVAWWEVPSPNGTATATHGMAVACPHADADGLIDAFEREGFLVRALDVRGWAMVRSAVPATSAPDVLHAVLDIGEKSAVLVIVLGGTIVFERSVAEAGMASLRAALQTELGLDAEVADHVLRQIGVGGVPSQELAGWGSLEEAGAAIAAHVEALTAETRASLAYVTHRYGEAPVGELTLLGEGAATRNLGEHLAASLELPVRTHTPADIVRCAPGLAHHDDPALAVAVGLALYRGDA